MNKYNIFLAFISVNLYKTCQTTYMSPWQSTPGRHICRFGSQPPNDIYVALAPKGLNIQYINIYIYNVSEYKFYFDEA